MAKRTDWHTILQDVLDDHLDIMSGKKIIEAQREASGHFRVDYYCRCDPGPARGRAATVPGIRPFDHLLGHNVIEYKRIHQTLTERVLRGYIAETLLLETRLDSQGDTTLTIILSRVPRKLLSENRYGFEKITPWKYRSGYIHDLEITILIQRATRGIRGGEPLAYLQVLEGDPRYQKETWLAVMDQEMERTEPLRNVIIQIRGEEFMSIISEEIEKVRPMILDEGQRKGEKKGELKGEMKALRRVLTTLVENKPKLRDRYAAKLASATTHDEIHLLETSIMRDLTG